MIHPTTQENIKNSTGNIDTIHPGVGKMALILVGGSFIASGFEMMRMATTAAHDQATANWGLAGETAVICGMLAGAVSVFNSVTKELAPQESPKQQ